MSLHQQEPPPGIKTISLHQKIFDNLSEQNRKEGIGDSRPPIFEEWRGIYSWAYLNDKDLWKQMANIFGDLITSDEKDSYALAHAIQDEPEKESIAPNVREFPTSFMFPYFLREVINAGKKKL